MNPSPSIPKPGFFESLFSAWETAGGRAVIAANLVPAIGLLFFGWDVFTVVFLYWFENVVIGVFQVFRMMMADGLPGIPADRITINGATVAPKEFQRAFAGVSAGLKFFLIPFFCVHYGAFTFAHGLFVMNLFGQHGPHANQPGGFHTPDGAGTAMAALMIIHSYIFLKDYLLAGEWRSASSVQLMMEPYRRIVILHIFIIASALFVKKFEMAPQLMLAVVFAKTAWDCRTDTIRRSPSVPSPRPALPVNSNPAN